MALNVSALNSLAAKQRVTAPRVAQTSFKDNRTEIFSSASLRVYELPDFEPPSKVKEGGRMVLRKDAQGNVILRGDVIPMVAVHCAPFTGQPKAMARDTFNALVRCLSAKENAEFVRAWTAAVK